MATMYSPSDPLFWSHHSNIERLFCIWQDCNDYELVNPNNITSTQYEPYPPPNNVCPGIPTPDYGLDTQMPYYYQGQVSEIFSNFPTPREVQSVGTEDSPSFGGLYVRYGSDSIVQNLENDANGNPVCTNNGNWALVNQPPPGESSKRNVKRTLSGTPNITFSNASNEQYTLDFLAYHLAAAAEAGLSGADVLQYIADIECMASPQREIDDKLEKWIIMEGGDIRWYDRSCDNTSARFCGANPDHPLCYQEAQVQEQAYESLEKSESHLAIISIVEGVVIVVLIILLVVSCVSKKLQISSELYTPLEKV